MSFVIQTRKWGFVNTDPLRRCYNGCNFSEEWQPTTSWVCLEGFDRWTLADAERRLAWWQGLAEYGRKERKEKLPRSEYRIAVRDSENVETAEPL